MKFRNFTFLIFPIIILALYIYQFYKIDAKLDSIFDEAFLFLKLQSTKLGNIEGASQWTTIINKLFNDKISSNILFLRYARYFLHILSVILFSVSSGWYLYKKGLLDTFKKIVLFLFIIFLLGYLSLGGIIISYNTLQEFFLLSSIGSYFVATVTNLRKSIFLYVLIGFISFFSIITILPSGLLLLSCILLLTWIKYFKEWKTVLIFTFSIVIGLFLSMLVFNFFIMDLRILYAQIAETTQSITKLNRGYDPFSLLISTFLYLRDFYIGICLMSGVLMISLLFDKYTKHWLAVIVFLLSMIAICVYQKKPEMLLTNFLSFPIIILFVLIFIESSKLNKQIVSFKVFLPLFLFFLPLISSIGTNVYLGTKMVYFILPWGVLLIELMSNDTIKVKYSKYIRLLLCFFCFIIFIQPIQSIVNDFKKSSNNENYFEKEKPISQIQLNKEQKDYYERVYRILKIYHYHRKDVIFSTQLDLMTVVAFDAAPCGLFFQPMDFLAEKNKKKLKRPDFIFLTAYDTKLMSDSIKLLDWGFPVEYDKYFVGTPETMNTEYLTTRTLYCLKSKKSQSLYVQ